MRRRLRALLLLAVAAPALVGALAASGAGTGDGIEFQELVGGLGLGTSVDPSRCTAAFDPRVSRHCALRHEPVPGSSPFCCATADGR